MLECAVLAEVRDGVAQLVAYLVADREVPRDTALDALRTTLPAALVPQRWVQLEALPTNGSGKIDYRALRTGPGVEPA